MQPPPVTFVVNRRRYSITAFDWPTYRDARAARQLAVEYHLTENCLVDAALAQRVANALGCLPGGLALRTDVAAMPTFTGAAGALQRQLNICLAGPDHDVDVKSYQALQIARRMKMTTSVNGLRLIGAVMRATVGEPDMSKGCATWRLPEAFFIRPRKPLTLPSPPACWRDPAVDK